MWKRLWRKWTIDRPAAFGDLLWDVLIVQLAAWLNRLDRSTIRHVVTIALALMLLLAYINRVPVHPGVMLMGDMLAYIDIFSMLFLLGILSRASTIMFILKQVAGATLRLARNVFARAPRPDVRHRRDNNVAVRKRPKSRARDEDDEGVFVYGAAWA